MVLAVTSTPTGLSVYVDLSLICLFVLRSIVSFIIIIIIFSRKMAVNYLSPATVMATELAPYDLKTAKPRTAGGFILSVLVTDKSSLHLFRGGNSFTQFKD